MAADAQKTVLLRITEDKASSQRVQQAIERTRANLRQMAADAKKVAPEIERASDQIRKMAAEAKALPLETTGQKFKRAFDPRPIEQFNAEMAELRRSIAGVGAETEKTEQKASAMVAAYRQAQAAQRATGNELPDTGAITGKKALNLRTLGADIKALPAVGIPGAGISTDVVGKIISITGRMNVGLAELAVTGGLAGVAIAGITVAQKAFNVSLEAGKAALEAAQTAQRNYYELVRAGDSQSAEARITELRGLLEQEQAIIAENARALEGAFADAQRQFGDAAARALFPIFSGETTAAIDEAQKNFDAYFAEYTRLNQAVAAGTFTARDAAAAEAELAKARAINAAANIDRLISAQQEAAQLAATGSSESLKARLDTLAIEKKAILDNLAAAQALAQQTGDSSQVDRLRSRLNDIDTAVNTLLFSGAGEAIAAREREQKAAEDAKKAADELSSSLDRVRDAQKKFADIQTAYNDKLADIAANLDKALSDKLAAIDEAIANAQDARAEAVAKSNDQLNENERQALLDREKLSRDHEKRVQKIMRDGARDSQRAIEDRDAVAHDRAQQAQDDALDDENDAYGERTKEIDQRLAEQNRTVSKRLVEQLQEVDKRLREQTQAAIRRYNEQVAVANQQTAAARDAYNRQLADLRAALAEDANVRNTGYTTMLNSSKSFAAGLQAVASSIINQMAAIRNAASGTRTDSGGSKTPTPMAAGGSLRAGTLAQVNEPGSSGRERFIAGNRSLNFPGMGLFIPQRSGTVDPGRGGSFTFAPVITGTSRAAIRRQVMTELDRVLDTM